MDLNAIKNRLTSLKEETKPREKREKKDYTLIYWKPKQEGKYQIRFIPSKINKTNPFQEIFMHYGVGKFPIVALSNWGEKDPIVDFTKKLRETSDSQNWSLAKKLDPKMRVFAPIIVRGEEEKGVRLFEFSKTLYLELLEIADDEDYGNFTDVAEGYDFVLTATKVEGRLGFNINLRPKPKQTVLNEDSSKIEEWLEQQPILLEERYKYPYDKLKETLQEFLTEGDDEDTITSEPASEFEGDKEEKTTPPKTNFSLDTQGTPKKQKSEEFDDMFEEDDLPF